MPQLTQHAKRSYGKYWIRTVLLWAVAACVSAGEPTHPPANRITGTGAAVGPAQALRTQDRAFALLVETYREFRSSQIEAGYQNRLRGIAARATNDTGYVVAVDSEVLRKLHALMVALAGKERELEHTKVQTQVDNWITAYQCARRRDEEGTGQRVPSQVDLREAATLLNDFVVIVPGLTLAEANGKPQARPARRFLLDSPAVELPQGHTVAPCTPQDQVTEYPQPAESSDDPQL